MYKFTCLYTHHRHLSNIDCLMAHTACLVCFISTVNGRSKKIKKKPWKMGSSSGHITNLKQSILETFDIYDTHTHTFIYLCYVLYMIHIHVFIHMTYVLGPREDAQCHCTTSSRWTRRATTTTTTTRATTSTAATAAATSAEAAAIRDTARFNIYFLNYLFFGHL